MLVVIFLCFISRAAGGAKSDDMILIDDEEEEPSINGTGAEDYFNHAWECREISHLIMVRLCMTEIQKVIRYPIDSILQIRSILKSIFRSAWNMVMYKSSVR